MIKRKSRRKTSKPRTAAEARKIKFERVEGGFGNGIDIVARVNRPRDVIKHLKARNAIDARQYDAAQHFREAVAHSDNIRSSADFSGAGGGGGTGSPVSVNIEMSARLADAYRILGGRNYSMVHMVCIQDKMLNEAAIAMAPGSLTSKMAVDLWVRTWSNVFKVCLSDLADHWFGREVKPRPHRPFVVDGARVSVMNIPIDPAARNVAHASRGKVITPTR